MVVIMSTVTIFLAHKGETIEFVPVKEKDLVKVSKFARKALAGKTGTSKRLDMIGIAPPALTMVLQQALKQGEKTCIGIKNLSVQHVVCLLEAINKLELEPPQPHVEGQLVYHLANKKITPTEMTFVHIAFGHLRENSKPWRVMVHQIAWDTIHNDHNPAEDIQALQAEAQKHPDLHDAINAKINEIKEKKRDKLAVAAAKKRNFEQKKRGKAQAEWYRRRDEHLNHVQELANHRFWQEKIGERPASKKTVEYILNDKVTYGMGTKKVSQRGYAKKRVKPPPQVPGDESEEADGARDENKHEGNESEEGGKAAGKEGEGKTDE